ncbi:MAG: hypothetical protein IJX28_01335 [Clostridia bacterium]|nr:hypothetical protein [Clostridia bacterium]
MHPPRKEHTLRYLSVVAVFCLICVVYLGRLFYIQIAQRQNSYESGTTTRLVTVCAVRGEIYDRNGNPLVKNRYTYDLILSYATFSASPLNEANKTALFLLEECAKEDKHSEQYFPFAGQYPYYSFTEEVSGGDSIPYYRLQRVLKEIGLEKDATAAEIRDYYVTTYQLLATDENGARLFSDDQVDLLLRLRYDMDAVQFSPSNDYVFATDVSMELMTRVKEPSPVGVELKVQAERIYCYPGYASHVLGTVGPIYSEEWDYYNEQGYQMNAIVGKTGCEAAFEEYLRGSDGVLLIEEDAAGNVIRTTVKKAPVAGSDVYLTIDIHLQIAAEDGLKENVDYVVDRSNGLESRGSNCQAGAAVALDPNTFEVLAIASYPTYDLTTYRTLYDTLASNPAQPLLNRALNGSYAPGSTFKPGVAAAGLLSGVIQANSYLECTGVYKRYESYQPKCATYASHAGLLTVKTAIADSCNCFFYELGYRMEIDTMNSYLKRFGFGQSTGFELGGTAGILAGPEYRQEIHGDLWTPGLTLSAAIGQSDNQASPLQLACYLGTLSNGGTRYSAHLLKSVYAFGADTPTTSYDASANVLDSFVLPTEYREVILEGMREMILTHTNANRFMSSLPVAVGGKTGTAQTSGACDNALFVCAAPYDAPEIVISVVLEQGYSGEYASLTAARILESYYNVQK